MLKNLKRRLIHAHKTIVFMILLFCLVVFPLISEAKEIDGWGEFKFGTEYENISKTLELSPLTVYQNNQKKCSYKKTNIKGLEFFTTIIFENGKIVKIILISMGKIVDAGDLVNIKHSIDEITASLIGKYGEPSRSWVEKIGPKKICKQWSGSGGTIIYRYEFSGGEMYLADIKYSITDDSI